MKKFSLAAVAALAANSAFAADLPSTKAPPVAYVPPPALTWTGFYVGLNAGGAFFEHDHVSTVAPGLFAAPTWATELALSTALASGQNSFSEIAFIGGGQIGYNYQFNSFVAGIEADIQGVAGGSGSSSRAGSGVPVGFPAERIVSVSTASKSLDYIGTVRGRLGYLVTPALLVYGTGGLAYGGVNTQASTLQSNLPFVPSFASAGAFSDTQVGWTAGGGVEWKFLQNWSAKVEYLYYDLGSVRFSQGPLAFNPGAVLYVSAPQTSARFDGHIARAGVNYHFNWGSAPILAKF